MPDDITRLSEALAHDPGGMAWVALADAFRRAGRLPDAERTALRGMARHPYHVDGHDVLARVYADRGDVERARDEWAMALSIDASHLPTLLGLAWLSLRGGDVGRSRAYVREAHARAPDDPRVVAAMARLAATADVPREALRVSRAVSSEGGGPTAYALFHDIERAGAQWVVLSDDEGLVTGGRVPGEDRETDAMAAELGVVASDATRTCRQLQLGEWQRIVMECDEVGLALAPAGEGAVVLMATPAQMPAGLARLLLDRAGRRAAGWLAAL